MKRSKMLALVIPLIFMGVLVSSPFSSFSQTTIDIQVSPNVLNLQNNGQVVTVHTDIAYSTVDAETVMMNGIVIDSWKADDSGFFVAKFIMNEIVGLPLNIGDYNELTLTGSTYSGETFTGTDQILVINVIPQGKK
jgi:hypothetical protein